MNLTERVVAVSFLDRSGELACGVEDRGAVPADVGQDRVEDAHAPN